MKWGGLTNRASGKSRPLDVSHMVYRADEWMTSRWISWRWDVTYGSRKNKSVKSAGIKRRRSLDCVSELAIKTGAGNQGSFLSAQRGDCGGGAAARKATKGIISHYRIISLLCRDGVHAVWCSLSRLSKHPFKIDLKDQIEICFHWW